MSDSSQPPALHRHILAILGILQARILGWVAFPTRSRGSSQPRDQTQVPHIAADSFFFNYYFYLAELGLSCSMWDLVPWPGIEPGPPALGAQRLRPQTTREIPAGRFFTN